MASQRSKIVGFWGPPEREFLEAMMGVIGRQGSAEDSFFEHGSASIASRRISIPNSGHDRQPVANEDGSIRAVHSGEIYNSCELREELIRRGHIFHTNLDAEVAVHVYEEYGPECFARFNGRWALAIVDLRGGQPRLVLCRDHFGIEPLYHATSGGRLLFASEIKSILQDRSFRAEPNDRRIYEYLQGVEEPYDPTSFFKGIRRLPAAHYATVDSSGYEEHAYWRPRFSNDGSTDPAEFRELLSRAIARRLAASMPVGVWLSDRPSSSLIACLISGLLRQRASDAPSISEQLKIFSAVFDDSVGEHVERMLEATGAEGYSASPGSGALMDELKELLWHQEEPGVSPDCYAWWCVMRLATTRGVEVLLDGRGGEELLFGYERYPRVYLRQLLRERRYRDLAREAWTARDVLLSLLLRSLAYRRRKTRTQKLLGDRFRKKIHAAEDYHGRDDLKTRLLQDLTRCSLHSPSRYGDGNPRAISVRSRQPFLDPELVEWVLRLAPEAIIRGGWSREVLREGLGRALPERIRPRRSSEGFTAPEIRWLKARRAEVQSILRSPTFCGRKYWDGLSVANAFTKACENKVEDLPFFWRVINAELWLRVFFDRGEEGTQRPPTPVESLERLEDSSLAESCGPFRPNRGKHLTVLGKDGAAYQRIPVRTRNVWPSDDLEEVIREGLSELDVRLRPGDLLASGEKIVAISQGRIFLTDEVEVGVLARFLSRFVSRTRSGIGFRVPEALQLAIQEAGVARILAATTAAALTRPLGMRGAFYLVAGREVTAIDSPVPDALPPCDTHIKLAPIKPDGVSEDLAGSLSEAVGGRVEVAVIDANDIGAEVLGASTGVDRELLVSLLRDNPLGQGHERTPLALIRRAGENQNVGDGSHRANRELV